MESKPLTNIDQFYQKAITDSNLVDVDYVLSLFSEDIQTKLRTTPYTDIDFPALAQTIVFPNEWTTKPPKGTVKPAIIKYDMKQGNIASIGTQNSKGHQNLFLLRNVKSSFANHQYSFGEEEKKELLGHPLKEFYGQDVEFGVKKEVGKLGLSFNIHNETEDLQTPQTMLQMKVLSLMHEIITLQVAQTHDPGNKFRCAKGFIKQVYDGKAQQDFVKLNCLLQTVPVNSFEEPLSIYKVSDPDMPFQEHVECKQVEYKDLNTRAVMNMLRLNDLDIVLAIGSASTKKEGKNLNVYPSVKIVQIVLKDSKQAANTRSHGLNLSSFTQ